MQCLYFIQTAYIMKIDVNNAFIHHFICVISNAEHTLILSNERWIKISVSSFGKFHF